jgi:hypothetical protein
MSPYHIKDYKKIINAVATLKDPSKSKRSKTIASNIIENIVSDVFQKHGRGVEIPVTGLNKIYESGRQALLDGQDLDDAMKQAIEEHRVKQ